MLVLLCLCGEVDESTTNVLVAGAMKRDALVSC